MKKLSIKRFMRRLLRGGFESSDDFVMFLRKRGIKVGDKCVFFDPNSTVIDTQRPYLLELGNSVKVTHGVIILTHDFSYSFLRIAYKDLLCSCKKTSIGNNVFIGMNAIIMPGVRIGDNCIIGAGAVVTHNVPDNTVWAGNPAKQIATLEQLYLRRKEKLDSEAGEVARAFYERYGNLPSISDMGQYFPLYLGRDKNLLKQYNLKTDLSGDYSDNVIQDFLESSELQKYTSFNDFLLSHDLQE